MADLKISEMPDGGLVQVTDEIPVNRSNANFKVKVGSGATANIGNDVGDVIVWADDGDDGPIYPPGDGSLITNLTLDEVDAYIVSYQPESSSSIESTNVQDAITELDSISQSKLENITGLILSGTNISITGDGTSESPYTINASSAPTGDYLLKDEPVVTANISGTYDIDFNAGQTWDLTATGDCDIDIINPPSMGGSIPVKIVQDSTPRTIDFVISGLTWANGAVPIMPAASGDFLWVLFVTDDGGATWTGFDCGIVEP